MTRHRNITRMEYRKANPYGNGWSHLRGWWVRFQRGSSRDGTRQVTSKMFSDGVYGGKRKALAAAIKWRDRTAKKLPPPKPSKHDPTPVGYGYTRRCFVWRRAGWGEVWVGWMKLGTRQAASSSASIERWGSKEAKRRVEAWLQHKRRSLKAS